MSRVDTRSAGLGYTRAPVTRIRLLRTGKKGQPSYRVVVADQRGRRDGRYVEIIGRYNPLTDPSTIDIDADRAMHWLSVGAQPSEGVVALLKRVGVWQKHLDSKKVKTAS